MSSEQCPKNRHDSEVDGVDDELAPFGRGVRFVPGLYRHPQTFDVGDSNLDSIVEKGDSETSDTLILLCFENELCLELLLDVFGRLKLCNPRTEDRTRQETSEKKGYGSTTTNPER